MGIGRKAAEANCAGDECDGGEDERLAGGNPGTKLEKPNHKLHNLSSWLAEASIGIESKVKIGA